jgi:hypothetical protein
MQVGDDADPSWIEFKTSVGRKWWSAGYPEYLATVNDKTGQVSLYWESESATDA